MRHLVGIHTGLLGEYAPGEEYKLIRKAGFDATFTGWESLEKTVLQAKTIADAGLIYDSIHAPFSKAASYWTEGEEGDAGEQELKDCIDSCAEVGVKTMVSHPFIGFRDHTPNEIGLKRYLRVADHAAKKGVKVCIENVEGIEYLDFLMKGLWNHPSIGFCFDSGHQTCYNPGYHLLSMYGERLSYLHINSNMGVTGDEITFYDDSHMLPFDGISDMEDLARHLRRLNYRGVLMTELVRGNRRGRHTNDRYLSMSDEEYLDAAYRQIVRLRDMVDTETDL